MSDRSILIVKQRVPYPLDIGSDAVTFGLLRVLQSASQVTLVTVDDGERAREGAAYLRGLGVDVFLAGPERRMAARQTAAGAVVRNAALLLAGTPRHLLSQSCSQLGPLLADLTSRRRFALAQFEYWTTARYRRFVRGPAALLNHDAWSRTVGAFARYERSPLKRLFWRLEARAVRRHELAAQSAFEWSLFLSEEDLESVAAGQRTERMAVLPVPFPFEPQDPAALPPRTAPGVLFVGAMNAEFNIDAACYFAERIWPAVQRAVPEARFTVAGREPADRVRRLAEHPGVRVEGDPDLDALLRTSRVAVSPARIGTGIKVKVAQAMAAGLPVVGTPAGLSGFGQAACLLRTSDPETFAEHVIRLLRDDDYQQKVSRDSYACYRDRYWMRSAAPKVLGLYERMMGANAHNGNGDRVVERAPASRAAGDTAGSEAKSSSVTAVRERRFEQDYFNDYAGRGTYRDYRLKKAFRTRLVTRFLSTGKLLEVGCAYGYLLRALEGRFECAGIDVSEHAISVARTVTKASVECGDVMDILPAKPGCGFDGVLAFDILEHLPEPQIPEVLGQFARILRPGGRLLVSVPNTRCLSRKVKKERWAGLRDATHISLLPPDRWLELLGGSFTVVATGGDGLWDIPYLPVVPLQLQRSFMLTYALAAATGGRFPRSLSENLIIAAEKNPAAGA